MHVLGVVLGRLVYEAVRIHAGLFEALELQTFLLGLRFGKTGLASPAAALTDAIEEGPGNQGGANPGCAGIDCYLGGG
jgi:hypothetical protein